MQVCIFIYILYARPIQVLQIYPLQKYIRNKVCIDRNKESLCLRHFLEHKFQKELHLSCCKESLLFNLILFNSFECSLLSYIIKFFLYIIIFASSFFQQNAKLAVTLNMENAQNQANACEYLFFFCRFYLCQVYWAFWSLIVLMIVLKHININN